MSTDSRHAGAQSAASLPDESHDAGQPQGNPSDRRPDGAERHPIPASFIRQLGITLVGLMIFTLFSVGANNFFTVGNLTEVMRFFSFVGIVGVGMTFLFIAGEFDLSVGSAYGFGTIAMAWMITEHGLSPWTSAVFTIILMTMIGVFNGIVTTVIGVPSFITTLGMFSLLRGASLVLSGSFPINYSELDSSLFSLLGAGKVWGVPKQVWWMLLVVVVGFVVLRSTVFGYRVYATGGNERAARGERHQHATS